MPNRGNLAYMNCDRCSRLAWRLTNINGLCYCDSCVTHLRGTTSHKEGSPQIQHRSRIRL